MIDAMRAVQLAKEEAARILSTVECSLEEIERETYKDQDVWSITLSFPRGLDSLPPFARLTTSPLQYKRFLISAETGDLLAIKIREVAVQ